MMCGIEIHQRIAGRKLFCSCPSEGGKSQQKASFSRKMHSVRSEIGELDLAMQLEATKGRRFHYSAPLDLACLVEADEEPPHPINSEALLSAIVFCKLFGSHVVDEVHIMRKNVIDGSNTSGFQRTAVIGLGGSIQASFGKVGIQTICIEEESAGIISSSEEEAEFDLSRLGIPLVEISTEPVFQSGKEAEEAAYAIGRLLRKTGLVQRGIGTIRQDLNISVPGGARVEIKGVQELSAISKTVDLEVQRQQRLISLSSQVEKRLGGKKIKPEFVDATAIFENTKSALVRKAINSGAKVYALKLDGHEGLLGFELGPNRRYGSELADYARSAGIKGLIHSDEDLQKYGFSDDEISELCVALSVSKGDAFCIAFGEEKKALSALLEVCNRANFIGVPEETRRANPDGTSSYMRPLPGKARMYPETDLPPIAISSDLLSAAQKEVEQMQQAQEEQQKFLSLVNEELSLQLEEARGMISHKEGFNPSFSSPEISAFAAAVENGVDPKFAASVLTNILQFLKREGIDTLALDEPRMLSFFLAYKEGVFAKAASQEILKEMCLDEGATPLSAAKKLGLTKLSGKELASIIEKEKLDFSSLMAKYRLRIDAAEAEALFKK